MNTLYAFLVEYANAILICGLVIAAVGTYFLNKANDATLKNTGQSVVDNANRVIKEMNSAADVSTKKLEGLNSQVDLSIKKIDEYIGKVNLHLLAVQNPLIPFTFKYSLTVDLNDLNEAEIETFQYFLNYVLEKENIRKSEPFNDAFPSNVKVITNNNDSTILQRIICFEMEYAPNKFLTEPGKHIFKNLEQEIFNMFLPNIKLAFNSNQI